MKTIILSPVYNEADQLKKLFCSLENYGDRVLLIDDGSTDDTYEKIRNSGFNYIRYEKNKGVSSALALGITWAQERAYDSVIMLDSDGQHDPDFIPGFEEQLKHYEFICGNRFYNPSVVPSEKLASNAIISMIVKEVYGINLFDISCGYKAFRLRPWVVETIRKSDQFSFIYDIFFRAMTENHKIGTVNIPCLYPSNELHYTKRIEILSFLKSIEHFLPLESQQWINYSEASMQIYHGENFELMIHQFKFWGFYLKEQDGYIVQTDMAGLQNYIKALNVSENERKKKENRIAHNKFISFSETSGIRSVRKKHRGDA